MKFTTEEKVSIISLMIKMSLVDNDAAVLENLIVAKTSADFGLSKDNLKKAFEEDIKISLAYLNDLNSDKKTFILDLLKAVAIADGEIDNREVILFSVIEKCFNM